MRLTLLLLGLLAACASNRGLDPAHRAALSEELGPRPEHWVVRGSYRDGAGRGDFVDAFALDGRFARVHHSALPGGAGDDGLRAWSLPIDGLARPAAGALAAEARVIAAVLAGTWPERLEVVQGGVQTYRLGLDGLAIATLHLDPTTRLPRELRIARGDGARRMVFEDWRSPLGFPVAHQVVLRNGRGPIASWHVNEVALEAGLFSAPPPPSDTRFDDSSAEVRARLAGARLLVALRAGDEDAGWWLVDSGAGSSAVAPALADRLGWPRVGEATLIGAAGRAASGLRQSGSLRVGPMLVEGLPLVEADGAALSQVLGLPVSGVLGADFLARCVLELDFAQERAWVLDPAGWSRPASATPITFDGTVPLVQTRFAPDHAGPMRLDTGSDDTVTFHGPTVRRLALARDREDLVTVRVRGVGGEVLGDRGPLEWLEVAGQRFSRLPVTFLRHSTGGLARADVAGNLGAGLLKGRRLVLALSHQCIVLE